MNSSESIYTVLLTIAAIVLLVAVGYVAYRNVALFDSVLPLESATAAVDWLRASRFA
ncbi:MAG: hypothetical protein ACOCTI_02060 [Phycisphaeraceae bacterium]